MDLMVTGQKPVVLEFEFFMMCTALMESTKCTTAKWK